MGDTTRLLILGAVLDVVKKQNLIEVARESGQALMEGLESLQVKERNEKYEHVIPGKDTEKSGSAASRLQLYTEWFVDLQLRR